MKKNVQIPPNNVLVDFSLPNFKYSGTGLANESYDLMQLRHY